MAEPIEKRYYSIGEIANMFDVNASLLRFWETEFAVLQPKKNHKGDRHYTKQDLDTVRLIHELVKQKGFTLQGARDFIRTKQHKKQEHAEVIATLQKLRTFLTDLRDGLDEKEA